MEAHDLTLPADALRVVSRDTLAGWNAYAHEQGRTSFDPAGVEVIVPAEPVYTYAAYVLGEAPDGGKFGLEGVPESMWLLVAALVYEAENGWRGRALEVRASAYRAQPTSAPPPNVMMALYKAAERYHDKRERIGLPLGVSLYSKSD
jgi:hypothetical protein